MEKYFPSTYQSGIIPSKSNPTFSPMTTLYSKPKHKQLITSQKSLHDRSYNHQKYLTFKKEHNKTVFLQSSSQRTLYNSMQKNDSFIKSNKTLVSQSKQMPTFFAKKKQKTIVNQYSLKDLKQLRQTDSTLCQSPKSHFKYGLKITDFKKLRLLGNGKYGSVYLVKHIATGFISAMKIIRKIDIQQLPAVQKNQMINQLIREIKIQIYLDHPNLVKLYTFFDDSFNIYLHMELGCDGQLYDLMKKRPKLKEDSVSLITREILEGLTYMHKNKIIHRDIKPENIVLIHGFAKICDFGWSVYCSEDLRSTFCGTPLYLSPQILKGNMYNQKIDTWAVGTLAYELYCADNPFRIKKKQDLSKIITEDFVMKTGSPQFRDFITFILKKDPTRRPNAQEIKNHQFIRKYKDLDTSDEICSLVYKKQISIHKSYTL